MLYNYIHVLCYQKFWTLIVHIGSFFILHLFISTSKLSLKFFICTGTYTVYVQCIYVQYIYMYNVCACTCVATFMYGHIVSKLLKLLREHLISSVVKILVSLEDLLVKIILLHCYSGF